MAYAVTADIERLMAQFVIGQASKPDKVQVDSIIADTEHEVNVILSAAGIIVPVTEPETFLNWLGLLVGYGATAAILKSMFPNASGPAETPAYAFWESRYKAGLKGIQDGTLIPGDALHSGTSRFAKPATYFTRNPNAEETLGDIAEPWFKRSKVF